MNSTVGDVSYSDLCYKPLGEFNKTHPSEDCATLSIFQWMDNDRAFLDNPTEYIKRLAQVFHLIIVNIQRYYHICAPVTCCSRS